MHDYTTTQKILNDYASDAPSIGFIVMEIAKRMTDRLDYMKIAPKQVLDIGYGLGIDYQLLKNRYRQADVYSIDFTINMLKLYGKNLYKQSILSKLFCKLRGQNTYSGLICANAINLPIASGVIDLVWSNLALPYINDLQSYFSEINRVLKLGGTFLVSGLGVDSLQQIRQLGLATYNFPDMHLIGDILVELGFSNPVTDIDVIKLEYDHPSQLLADLCCVGGGMSLKRLATKQMEVRYKKLEANFWQMTDNGKFPLTLEVFYAHAWKDQVRKDLVSGRSIISFYPKQ